MSSQKRIIQCPYCQKSFQCDVNADYAKSLRSHCIRSHYCRDQCKRVQETSTNSSNKQQKPNNDVEELEILRERLSTAKHLSPFEEVSMEVDVDVHTDYDNEDSANLISSTFHSTPKSRMDSKFDDSDDNNSVDLEKDYVDAEDIVTFVDNDIALKSDLDLRIDIGSAENCDEKSLTMSKRMRLVKILKFFKTA